MTIASGHLFWAYRVAKFEVAAERRGVGRLSFAAFERGLAARLRAIDPAARNEDTIFRRVDPGKVWVRPKSISKGAAPERGSVMVVPERVHDHQIEDMSVRVLLEPTPQFATMEVVWLRAFGPALETLLSKDCMGNRLDLRGAPAFRAGVRKIFRYWAADYRLFRAEALGVAKRLLNRGAKRCLLATLDLASYYDRIDAGFLLDPAFVDQVTASASRRGIPFDALRYRAATEGLLAAYVRFRAKTKKEIGIQRDIGVPIGSLASKLIANLALVELDRKIRAVPGVRHYARYVDDIHIVEELKDEVLGSAADVVARFVTLDRQQTTKERLVLDAAVLQRPRSSFVIQESKLRVFDLSGDQGIEYLSAIEAEMTRVSSERRRFLEPWGEELDQTVMASPNAEPIRGLREADALSLRRLAVGTVSDKVATAAAMLDRSEASQFSRKYLGKVGALATDWSRWADLIDVSLRILGSALLSGDEATANEMIAALAERAASLTDGVSHTFTVHWGTDELGVAAREKLREWIEEQLAEVIASATPFSSRQFALPGLVAIQGLKLGARTIRSRSLLSRARLFATADLRLTDRETDRTLGNPRVARRTKDVHELVSELRQDAEYQAREPGLLSFLVVCDHLNDPTFSGLTPPELLLLFRPPTYDDVLFRWLRAERPHPEFLPALNALRSTRYKWLPFTFEEKDATVVVAPPDGFDSPLEVSRTKLILGNLTSDEKWWEASLTSPALTMERQRRLARVINLALDATRWTKGRPPSLLILPELSLPRRWLRQVAAHLSRSEPLVSMIAGLEYEVADRSVFNEVVAYFPRSYSSAAMWMWTKRRPAHHEAQELHERGFSFDRRCEARRFVRVSSEHGLFVPLVCSELLEVDTRARLLGRVDFVPIPAWNPDTTSFEHLVHAVALELHSFVAVANNGKYSDCRIRAPFADAWKREVCRLISPGRDEVVSAELPVAALREYRAAPAAYDARRVAWLKEAKRVKEAAKRGTVISEADRVYLGECPWPEWKPAPPSDMWPGREN